MKAFKVCIGRVCLLGQTVLALTMVPALAQGEPEGFTIGLGAGAAISPYVGEDETTFALPLIGYNSDQFSISTGQGLRLTAIERGPLRISAVVSPRFSGLDDTDVSELDGIDRELTADAGLVAEYGVNETLTFTAGAVTEITNEHDGQEVTLGISQRVLLGRFPVQLSGGFSWQSSDLSEYVYGVKASEATAGRPAYAPGDVFIPYVGVGTVVPVSDNASMIAGFRAEFLPDEVTDSPIVDEDVVPSLNVGVAFSF